MTMTRAEKLARAAKARAALFGSEHEQPSTELPAHTPQATAAADPKRPRAEPTRHPSGASVSNPAGAHERPENTLVHLLPKKWDAPPARGDLVFYRNERFWVEVSTVSFMQSVWIRIGDHRVRKDDPRPLDEERTSFYVHVDELVSVPPDFNKRAARLPTPSSVARAERAKAGARDIGDEIAQTLRACADLGAVYAAASEYLDVPEGVLKEKYGKLNPGQQRMNLGNRMRAKWRKEHA